MSALKLTISPQQTIITCLSVCLISHLRRQGFVIPEAIELDTLTQGLKFTKFDYTTGQLVYIAQNYPTKITQYIDYLSFYNFLSQYRYPNNISQLHQPIDLQFLKKIARSSPIIYIDQYYLEQIHMAHFVILNTLSDETSIILDPWDGQTKSLPTKTLLRSIQSLRNNLKISPIAIILG